MSSFRWSITSIAASEETEIYSRPFLEQRLIIIDMIINYYSMWTREVATIINVKLTSLNDWSPKYTSAVCVPWKAAFCPCDIIFIIRSVCGRPTRCQHAAQFLRDNISALNGNTSNCYVLCSSHRRLQTSTYKTTCWWNRWQKKKKNAMDSKTCPTF